MATRGTAPPTLVLSLVSVPPVVGLSGPSPPLSSKDRVLPLTCVCSEGLTRTFSKTTSTPPRKSSAIPQLPSSTARSSSSSKVGGCRLLTSLSVHPTDPFVSQPSTHTRNKTVCLTSPPSRLSGPSLHRVGSFPAHRPRLAGFTWI